MTGYLQADILGKARGLKFGTLAAENILVELSALGVATGGNYNSAMMATVIYWGLYNNAFVKKETLDVTFEQICDWVDDHWYDAAQQKIMTEIVQTYETSKHSVMVLEKLEKQLEELKKKKVLPPNFPTDPISPPAKDGKKSAGSRSASSGSRSKNTTTPR
jgi:hypothetical protein